MGHLREAIVLLRVPILPILVALCSVPGLAMATSQESWPWQTRIWLMFSTLLQVVHSLLCSKPGIFVHTAPIICVPCIALNKNCWTLSRMVRFLILFHSVSFVSHSLCMTVSRSSLLRGFPRWSVWALFCSSLLFPCRLPLGLLSQALRIVGRIPLGCVWRVRLAHLCLPLPLLTCRFLRFLGSLGGL